MSRARMMGQGQKVTRVPSNGQNWENKDLTPKVTFPTVANFWSYGLDPLTSLILLVMLF